MRNKIYKDQSYKAGKQRNWDDTERLKKFKYQYFITRGGPAPFRGYGSSIKKVQRTILKVVGRLRYMDVEILIMAK